MKKADVKDKIIPKCKEFKYSVDVTNTFKKDFIACWKRGLDTSLVIQAVEILAIEGKLPEKYHPHKLEGIYKNLWECHIKPDWLLIWQQNDKELILLLTNTGTHSDLFR